ncbi:MAG: apolipoprotein N-acyltransferase [Acidobacteriaceae bacterium]|nr:apolipoprotein N-acyltransferase [Acidobacteriaceae bacterium]
MPKLRSGAAAIHYRRIVLRTLLSLATAFLLLAIFPKFNLRFLAPVALTPLLIALARTEQGWQRFLFGWAAGIFYWFFLCTWIEFVLEVHGGMGVFGAWGSFILFCVLKALHLAVFSWLAGPLMRRAYAIPAIAALWTGLERTHGTFGFAWLALGNAGISMSVPLRVAPFVGVYGVSFVFAMLAAALACVILRHPRMRLVPLAALGLLFLLPAIPENIPTSDSALVVQPNINPNLEWTALLQEKTERELSAVSDVFQSNLVIWPELPAPLYYYDDREFHDAATTIARRHGYFLFGTVAYTGLHQPLNSAVLLGPEGAEIGRYDKIDLVPFGEFVPRAFWFVNRITQEAGDFAPGRDIKVLPAAGHCLGVFICYESAFPDLVREFSRKGADVLVNLSNDAYFGHSEAREQHLLLARMRAIENRRYLIRATNDGITAVVNPAGEIIQQLPLYKEVAAPMRYGVVGPATFYTRHGDWFAWICLAAGVGLSLRDVLRRRQTHKIA